MSPIGHPRSARSAFATARRTLSQLCAQFIVDFIEQEHLEPGAQLPSEDALAALLDVSRATVREALQSLAGRRIVTRKHGKGTFVAERPIEKDLGLNFGITAMIEFAGYRPSTARLDINTVPASSIIAEQLSLSDQAPVTTISRVRLADTRPVVDSLDVVDAALLPAAEVDVALQESRQSIYELLHRSTGIVIDRGQAVIEPVKASRQHAARLSVAPGSALLRITQTDYAASGRPVVYSVEYHVADWVRFVIGRVGPGDEILTSEHGVRLIATSST